MEAGDGIERCIGREDSHPLAFQQTPILKREEENTFIQTAPWEFGFWEFQLLMKVEGDGIERCIGCEDPWLFTKLPFSSEKNSSKKEL